MAKALVLTTLTGTQIGRRYTLGNRTNTIGSANDSDMVLHDRQLDLRHAEVRQMLDRWFIAPMTSVGSLLVNGSPVKGQSRLNQGDKLTIGAVTFLVGFEELVEREAGASQRPGNDIPRLGDYLVRRGIMTTDEVNRVARRQTELQRNGSPPPFGQVAVEMGFISRVQLEKVLADQRSDFNDRFWD